VTLLNPGVWLVALALMAGAYGTGRWQQWRADDQAAQAARLKATEAAREKEANWQIDVEALNDVHQTELQRIAADRDRAVRELRNRPAARMPATATCSADGAGATGAQLSGPDAEAFAGLAADADRTAADLRACQAWIATVTEGKTP